MITAAPSYIPDALVGRTLGKYQIREIIGRGGMGVVFKVWDTLEDRVKAIKMVPPEVASSPLAFEDLKREISMASGIVHPNVVKVLSLEAQDGQYFIVMEYIEGDSLEKRMALAEDRKLPEGEVIRIMKKTAEGMIEAHARKVIHRDLKPRNIMETGDGQVKILDFGVSHRMSRSLTELTGRDFSGTWPYMAPEQLSNRFGRENQQVDIWSFGITLYQLLSGEVPFRNRDQIVDPREKPFPLRHISTKTQRIIMKCLEKDRKKRYQDMTEVLQDLEEIKITAVMKKGSTPAAQVKTWKRFLEWPRAAAAFIVILAAVFLYYTLNLNQPFSFNLEAYNAGKPGTELSPHRQAYEGFIREAREAENRGDYTTALSLLEKAKKIVPTPRLEKQIREISARGQTQQIKADSRQLTAFLNSPAPAGEKIAKCLAFLKKYKNIASILNQEKDAEILALIAQIQSYLEQLQVRIVTLADLPAEFAGAYYEKIRRIEIPGLPAGVRVLGQVDIKTLISEKGRILPQHIDITGLQITGTGEVEAIKMMVVKHLGNVALEPPRDKNGAPVKVKDWNLTFKVGTFQDKIILLHEG